MCSKPILTIAIPTYNRAPFLEQNLKILIAQQQELSDRDNVEICISDNASTDATKDIVSQLIQDGAPIRYYRNENNLGMDKNFILSMRRSHGEYIWILGDDDYLECGALNYILSILKNHDYGLIVFPSHKNSMDGENVIYENGRKFLKKLSFMVTFISTQIFHRKYIDMANPEKYIGTLFVQVPVYMTSALNSTQNLFVSRNILQAGNASHTNGGYNLYKVFLDHYFSIWRCFIKDRKSYEIEKYKIFRHVLLNFICSRLLHKQEGNFDHNNGWQILFKYYWYCPYFYILIPVKMLHLFLRSKVAS